MTTIANLPAQLLYVAAQFASTDRVKELLTAIRVRPAGGNGGVIIDSVNGHSGFRVVCPDPTWCCDQPLLLSAKALKKRIPHARRACINASNDNQEIEARIMGGAGMAEFMQSIPCTARGSTGSTLVVDSWPNYDRLRPTEFSNAANAPIRFNAQLLSDFLAQVSRYTDNGVVTMQHNTPTTPLVFTGTINQPESWLADVTMEFLLMPVVNLNRG
jgi:hypothetical protein